MLQSGLVAIRISIIPENLLLFANLLAAIQQMVES